MSVFSDYTFLGSDGITNIHVRRCSPDGKIKGIVHIVHGISEHVERYDPFAAFLAENGYITIANDLLGHGRSISGEERLGFFADENGWDLVTQDIRKLRQITMSEFSDLPCFMFGHSMGSFLARTYIIKYPDDLSGVIICGTGQQSPTLVQSGRALGRAEIKRHGIFYRSPIFSSIAFDVFNKEIANKRTDYDWLSRDEAVIDSYIADPLCGGIPSAGLFTDLMDGIAFMSKMSNMKKMRKSLPVLFISGDKDPVGEYTRGVLKSYKCFLDAGMEDITLKLYHGGRHEILNDLCKDQVMSDVLNWINTK